MKRPSVLFRLLILLAALSSSVAADLESLNGTWVIAEGEFEGNPLPAADVAAAVLTIRDGRYTFDLADTHAAGTFVMDFKRTPALMTVSETEGPNAGKSFAALTEITPKGWRACYNPAGGAAPTTFATTPGSGLVLVRYERKPGTATAAAGPPLKVLLVIGGCCHDYGAQKDILKQGLESRANVHVDIIYSSDSSTHPPLPIYGKPDYAAGYDVVLHDECASDISDQTVVEGVLKPHREGIPAVNLHCAMHCYRIGNPNDPATPGTPHALWFDYLGLQSSGHGSQNPIAITFKPDTSPITKGLGDWTTVNEELYNNIKIWDDTRPLARGKQGAGDKPGQNDTVVVWTHEYGPQKTRVFATTLGHNNATVADSRYLDLVTRGLLWACGKLGEDGRPVPGYAAVGR